MIVVLINETTALISLLKTFSTGVIIMLKISGELSTFDFSFDIQGGS